MILSSQSRYFQKLVESV